MALTWTIIRWFLLTIVLINEVAAIYTVFREKRDIAATWAWLLVLTLIPVIGFIIYAFLGRKLPHRRLNLMKTQTQLRIQEAIDRQKRHHQHAQTSAHYHPDLSTDGDALPEP